MRKLKDVTIQFVSFVTKGANKRKFFLTKEEDQKDTNKEFPVRTLFKKDDPQQLVYGVVYEPEVEDAHGDIMDADEIEKMAHDFLVNYRLIDKQHNRMPGAGEVVESYIAPNDFQVGKEIISKGSWVLVTKADDETWLEIQDGNFTGYSMAGWASETEDLDETEKSKDKKENIFTRIAKFFGIEITKDFNTELENSENNDVYRYVWILERAIDKIVWREEDAEEKRTAIVNSLEQMATKVRGMTFEVKKSDEEGEEMDKNTILKALKEDKELMKAVLEELNKDDAPAEPESPEPTAEPTPEPESKPEEKPGDGDGTESPEPAGDEETEKSDETDSLKAEITDLKKQLEEISDLLMLPKAKVGLEKEAPVEKRQIRIRSKVL